MALLPPVTNQYGGNEHHKKQQTGKKHKARSLQTMVGDRYLRNLGYGLTRCDQSIEVVAVFPARDCQAALASH
jgi:hypothetical protein